MMPVALAAADRFDAFLRVGGLSVGADEEGDNFIASDQPVFNSFDELPEA